MVPSEKSVAPNNQGATVSSAWFVSSSNTLSKVGYESVSYFLFWGMGEPQDKETTNILPALWYNGVS